MPRPLLHPICEILFGSFCVILLNTNQPTLFWLIMLYIGIYITYIRKLILITVEFPLWLFSPCDYSFLYPLAESFSLCSCTSTEWLISRGQDKRLVSMATTCAHVNMHAVYADKAWHYVLLSLGLSANVQHWVLHKSRKCTCTLGQNSEGKLLIGHLWPMTLSQRCKVKESSERVADLWQNRKVFYIVCLNFY